MDDVRNVIEDIRSTYDTPNALLRVLLLNFINKRGLAEDFGNYVREQEDGDYADNILDGDVLA